MEKAKKILYIAQELEPYVSESELSTMFRNLIPAVQETGREARTFTPKWGSINERRNMLHEVIRLSGANLIIDGSDHQLIIKVASIPAAHMQVYFIDNDDFMRGKLILRDKDGKFYRDNVERSMFFCRGTIETMKKLRWTPELCIVLDGWELWHPTCLKWPITTNHVSVKAKSYLPPAPHRLLINPCLVT